MKTSHEFKALISKARELRRQAASKREAINQNGDFTSEAKKRMLKEIDEELSGKLREFRHQYKDGYNGFVEASYYRHALGSLGLVDKQKATDHFAMLVQAMAGKPASEAAQHVKRMLMAAEEAGHKSMQAAAFLFAREDPRISRSLESDVPAFREMLTGYYEELDEVPNPNDKGSVLMLSLEFSLSGPTEPLQEA